MPGYIVVFGTGKYLGLSDFNSTQTQTVYGIWDYGDDSDDDEFLGEFNRGGTPVLSNQSNTVSLLMQEEIFYGLIDSTYMRVISSPSDDPKYKINYEAENDSDSGEHANPSSVVANHAGWYFDLPLRKERMVKDLMIRGGKVIFITTLPSASVCSAGGESILHEINAGTGARLEDAQFDINNDRVVDEHDMIEIEILNSIGEVVATIMVAPSGIWFPTMLYPPSIIGIDREEIKLMSTAAGGIIDVREVAEQKGMVYWRQID